ncbi:Uncharacterised protein [Mycobacteroides abscessus subsp. abscessus]|nr:Uncharacterised protein [Mycobacteroides abscessus subsp. abscessus]
MRRCANEISMRSKSSLRNPASEGHAASAWRSMRTSPEYTRGIGQNTAGDTVPRRFTLPK